MSRATNHPIVSNLGLAVQMTDHKSLVSLFGEPKQVPITASPRVQRWAITRFVWVRVQDRGSTAGNAIASDILATVQTHSGVLFKTTSFVALQLMI